MCPCPDAPAAGGSQPAHVSSRGGLTLLEMLISISIVSIIALAMSGLAITVRQTTAYTQGYGTALQHGRVVLERIHSLVSGAYTTPNHPGVVVVFDPLGSYRFPDTLLVWRPAGTPANAAGPPLLGEVVIVCPDPADPSRLVEITAPGDTRPVPLDSAALNTTAWRNALAAVKTADTSRKTVLTNLLRTARTSSGATGTVRGAVRFECELHPTAAEWASYQAGSLAWQNLSWPQGLYHAASRSGLRQVWVRSELQLLPDALPGQQDASAQQVVPLFGSTAVYYTLDGT